MYLLDENLCPFQIKKDIFFSSNLDTMYILCIITVEMHVKKNLSYTRV
jgi:hypothetical protein